MEDELKVALDLIEGVVGDDRNQDDHPVTMTLSVGVWRQILEAARPKRAAKKAE